jgi:hypothetical protein
MIKLSDIITYDQLAALADDTYSNFLVDVMHKFNNDVVAGTEHPIHYYIRKDIHDRAADAIYDIVNNEWIKEPHLIEDNFIEEKYPEVIAEADNIAKQLDISLGDLKRNILDYKYLNTQLNLTENKDKIVDYIEEKLDTIDSDLKSLLSEFDILYKNRKEVFSKDPDTVKDINDKYFKTVPLDLERL